MRIARHAAVIAAALAGVACIAAPARAGSAEYEFIRKLADHRLRMLDLADRAAEAMASSKDAAVKAEGLLAKAYLLKVRGDLHPVSEPKKRLELYAGSDDGKVEGALQFIAEFEKTADAKHRLRGEAVGLKSAIMQERSRVVQDLRRSLPPDDPLVAKLQKEIDAAQDAMLKQLDSAMSAAEADMTANSNDDKKYEAYVMATQRYVVALVKAAEGKEEGGEERQAAGRRVVEFIENWFKAQSKPYHREPPEGVKMWMWACLGRAYVLAGDIEKAVSEGFKKVREIDPTQFEVEAAQKWALDQLLRAAYVEAEALYEWGVKTGDRKYYEEARKAYVYQYSQVSGTMLGIRARILNGQVLGKLGELEAAMSALDQAVTAAATLGAGDSAEREYAPDLRARALRAMSEIVLELLQQGRTVEVAPEVLVEAGVNCYQQRNFGAAVSCFREAIRASRRLEFEKRAVLGGEPKAWYCMGLAYHRMDAFLDAQLAYEGALEIFLEQNMPEAFRKDQKNAEIIAQIKRDVLVSCASNGRRAANAEKRLNPSKFSKARELVWYEWEVRLDPSKEKDIRYYKAMMIMDEADQVGREAKELGRDDKVAQALTRREEAIGLYDNAKREFLSVPESSALYEEGLYFAGVCSYQQMDLMDVKWSKEGDKERLKEYGQEALEHFKAYKDWIAKTAPRPTGDAARREQERQEIERRRTSRKASIDLYRPFILFAMGDLKGALTAAEALLPRRDLDANQLRGLHRILLKCYLEIVGNLEAPEEMEVLLGKGEKELSWFKEDAAKAPEAERADRELGCDSYLNQLATAYGKASRLARRKGQGETFGRQFQERQATLLKELLAKPIYQSSPDGLLMVAKLFIELDNYQPAFEAYEMVLKKFDPDDNRCGLLDDQLIKFEKLADSNYITNTENVRTGDEIAAVRSALKAIEPLVTGTPEEKDAKGNVRTPAVPPDYDRATIAIDEFLKAYPGYDMKKEGKKGDARMGLDQLNGELIFRLQLLKAANGMTTCLVRIGEGLKEEASRETDATEKGKMLADAKKAFEDGLNCARDAAKYWPKDADAKYNVAVCLLESAEGNKGRLEEAATQFDDLRRGVSKRGDMFWKATRGAFRARLELAKYDESRVIMVNQLLSDPEGTKENWVDLQRDLGELATRMGKKPEEIVPPEVKVEQVSYKPVTSLEKFVQSKKNFVLPRYVSRGEISKEEAELRASLLDELVDVYLNRREALRACADSDVEALASKISLGLIRSLKNIGGKSRGEKDDRAGPKLKTEQGAGEEPKARPEAAEEQKQEEQKEEPKAGDQALLVPAGGRAC